MTFPKKSDCKNLYYCFQQFYMFQIWLGSFKRGKVQQIPVQRLNSLNKEQVMRSYSWSTTANQTSHFLSYLKYHVYSHAYLLDLCNGPACNVFYLNSVETESLTGPEAVSKATKCTMALNPRPVPTVVHFKVSSQGITLTDSKRRYPLKHIEEHTCHW